MKPVIRYFFTVLPNPQECATTVARANELQARLGLSGNRVVRDRLNATVQFIGAFDAIREDVEQCALAIGNQITGLHEPLTFDSAMRFEGEYGKNAQLRPAMFLPTRTPTAWRAQAQRIRDAFFWLPGAVLAQLPPHITFIYTDNAALDRPVPITPILWQPHALCLARSTQRSGVYKTLGSWAI